MNTSIHKDQLTTPLIRKEGVLKPASREEALDLTAQELGRIREATDNQGLAMMASAKCTNEENCLLQLKELEVAELAP